MAGPKDQLETVLQRRLNFERVVTFISSLLIDLAPENEQERVNAVLQRLGEFSEVERTYLFRLDSDRDAMVQTHEWSAPGVAPALGRIPELPLKDYPWWLRALQRGEIIHEDVSQIPPEAEPERRLLESLRIRAGIAVPLRWGDVIEGVLGISFTDRPITWSREDIRLVKLVAQLLSKAFHHQQDVIALRVSNGLLNQAERVTHSGSWRWDADSGRITCSEETYRIFGRDSSFAPTGENVLNAIHPEDRARHRAAVRRAVSHGTNLEETLRIIRPDHSIRYLQLMGQPLRDQKGSVRGFIGVVQDLSETVQTRALLDRVTRALQTISACNRALIRAHDENQLLGEVCRIVVEVGKYRSAWITLTDGTTPALPPDSEAGMPPDFSAELLRREARGEAAPYREALRSRGPFLVPDIESSSLPNKEVWLTRGLRSCVALPLMRGDELGGVMEIYAEHPQGIDRYEAEILEQLAADLAYGVGALQTRRARDEAQRSLQASEESLRAVVEKEADGVLVLDRAARILFANPAAQVMFGRDLSRLQGETFAFPLVVGEMVEIELLRPDGTRINAEMRAAETEWYKVPALVIALHDVTQQRKAQAQQRIWATVLERSGELIFVTDRDKRIIAVNKAFEKITGYSAEEALGRDPHFLSSGLEDKAFYAQLWHAINAAGHWQGEIRDRRKSGEVFPLWLAITAANGVGDQVENYIAIGSDISARKAAEERIQFLAYHDVLTGLPNRALFRDRLELAKVQADRRDEHVGVLFIDLDRFKNVNDSLGHEAGDELLRAVADRIKNSIRREDTVSRQGGDEFLILLSQLSCPDRAGEIAGKIVADFIPPFPIHGTEVHITPSIGIAVYPDDGEDTEVLVKNADAAMYFAKEEGRNNFQFFVSELNQRVSARFAMENALRRAMEHKEFELYYQPQVNVRTGHVVGVEALLRWRHDGRIIGASEFVGIAEETGLIMPIGEWVLQEACRQSAEWVRAGLPRTRMAINLSAAQFLRKGALDRLRDIMMEGCCDPTMLEVELTEGMIMQEAETSMRSLQLLKEIGVSLAIDDFGTGYSSLNYLRRFPLDRLKVDQSFVRDLPKDPADRAVTEAIIALARSLHLAVVAEGVETEEEMRLLEERSCEEIQGFFFSRPRPAAEIALWWRERLNKG